MRSRPGGWTATIVFAALALALGGCGSLSGGITTDSLALAAPSASLAETDSSLPPLEPTRPSADVAALPDGTASELARSIFKEEATVAAEAAGAAGDAGIADATPLRLVDASLDAAGLETTDIVVAQADKEAPAKDTTAGSEELEEYDPLEKFNEAMFEFNRFFDKWLLKPVAQGYNVVVPDEIQRMIGRGFTNINFVPRFVNNLLQAKWAGAGRELARFLINSVVGIGGLWDMAKQEWNIEASKADFGQTLGKWGMGPGPYLVLPFMPPLTFRDGIGYAVDGAMDPLSYVLPFIPDRLVMKIGDMINDRSLNLDLFQGFEETTVDFYSAVRNSYLQRRYRLIHEEN